VWCSRVAEPTNHGFDLRVVYGLGSRPSDPSDLITNRLPPKCLISSLLFTGHATVPLWRLSTQQTGGLHCWRQPGLAHAYCGPFAGASRRPPAPSDPPQRADVGAAVGAPC
jgi:hypothetical protein